MHQLTNNIDALLKKLASMLPQVSVHSNEKHFVMGSEILTWGTVDEIDGKPIVPDKKYLWRYPVITCANHHRRLRNKYKSNGIDGIKKYLEWISRLAKGKKANPQMQALMEFLKEIDEN